MANEIQNNWKEHFVANPPELAGGVMLSVEPAERGRIRLRLRHAGVQANMLAAFLSVPYPSGLRRLRAGNEDLEAVVVEHIPSGLDSAADELGVSYLDRHGFGRLVAPGFVYVAPRRVPGVRRMLGDDLPDEAHGAGLASPGMRSVGVAEARELQPAKPRPRVSPFAPKASRLVRALLAHPERSWRLSEIASEVEVDPGNAHRVLGSLLDLALLERDEDHYLVPDPGSLLEAWAEAAPRPRERVVVPVVDGLQRQLENLIAPRPDAYAVSGECAAELMAPYLDSRQALVHCLDGAALAAVQAMGEEVAPQLRAAGRIEAVPADERVGDFGSVVDGLPLVSPAQLYVDLFRQRGRAREAAEHVRREVLAY